AVAELLQEILGIEPIGVADNFFELGGDSLLAIQVVSRIRRRLGVNLGLRVVFEQPTIRAMAAALTSQNKEQSLADLEAKPIEPTRTQGPWPLSYAQQRLWFLQQLEPESAAYNIVMAMRLTGCLAVEAVRQCFAEIERRHEVLRTRFE